MATRIEGFFRTRHAAHEAIAALTALDQEIEIEVLSSGVVSIAVELAGMSAWTPAWAPAVYDRAIHNKQGDKYWLGVAIEAEKRLIWGEWVERYRGKGVARFRQGNNRTTAAAS